MRLAVLVAFSYLVGSVPFGLIIARAKGVDLRGLGSGNIGATNALRALGKWPALFTLIGDLLKGTASVALGRYIGMGLLEQGLMGLGAVFGHVFSAFLGFKGGKGVATGIGVLLIYSPKAGIITLIIWAASVALMRYSSLGAIIGFGLLPLNIFLFDYSKEKIIVITAMSVLIVFRHSGNIKRMLKGTERKIGGKA